MEKEKDVESVCSSENLSELIAALNNNSDETPLVKPKPRFDCFTYSVVIILLCLFVGGLIVNMNHLNTIMEDTSRIKDQNVKNFAMMNKLNSQYQNIESQMKSVLRVSRISLVYPELSKNLKEKVLWDENFWMMKEQNRTEEMKKTTCLSLIPSTTIQPPQTKQKVTQTTTNPPTTTTVKPATPVVSTSKASRKLPKPIEIKVPHFNAASYLSGASVLLSSSSPPANSSEFSFDHSNYVIIEREPVPNRAWCTNSENPYLTISLSKGVKPIAFSYQHLKWNGTIPDGAPMEYDVVARYEKNVEVPLALNCKYESSGPQEQKCLIPLNSNYVPKVSWIRFYFRKNHGNSKTTCAYLIRVFAEGNTPIESAKSSKETCSSLIWHRKNSPFFYNYILEKNCKVWYKNDCCTECPECCTECVAKDMNYKLLLTIGMFILIIIVATLWFTKGP